MITLKRNQVFRNQNLLDVSLPMIILLTKHVSFWVANFRGLAASFTRLLTLSWAFFVGHICITKNIGAFTQGVSISAFYYSTQVLMLCEQWNSAELSSTVLSPLINHQGWCLMTPCTIPMNAISQCLCNALCHCISIPCLICNECHMDNKSHIMDNYIKNI